MFASRLDVPAAGAGRFSFQCVRREWLFRAPEISTLPTAGQDCRVRRKRVQECFGRPHRLQVAAICNCLYNFAAIPIHPKWAIFFHFSRFECASACAYLLDRSRNSLILNKRDLVAQLRQATPSKLPEGFLAIRSQGRVSADVLPPLLFGNAMVLHHQKPLPYSPIAAPVSSDC